MGFLKNLKAGIEAAQAAGNAMAGAQAIPDIPDFVRPQTQDEVDRLLADTGYVRAIIYGKNHQVLERGERVGKMNVRFRVRQRLAGQLLGDEVEFTTRMSSLKASLLVRGLDVPVVRDASGTITGFDAAQLDAELAGMEDEAERRNPAWGLDDEVEGMIEVGKRIVNGPPAKEAPAAPPASASDPRRQPVEGISWETYVAVRAHIQVHGAPNSEDVAARPFGVRAYTWPAISNVWNTRIKTDPELEALYERDLAEAIKSA